MPLPTAGPPALFHLIRALVLGFGLLLGCSGQMDSLRQGDQLDVTSYPKDIRDAYAVFAVRCSRCHSLARPLNAHISDPQHWVRYVHRMRLQPGSGIGPKAAEQILHFLLFYAELEARRESFPYTNRLDSLQGEATEPPSQPAASPSATDSDPSSSNPPTSTQHETTP